MKQKCGRIIILTEIIELNVFGFHIKSALEINFIRTEKDGLALTER